MRKDRKPLPDGSTNDRPRTQRKRVRVEKREASGLAGPSPEQHGPIQEVGKDMLPKHASILQDLFTVRAEGQLHPLPGSDLRINWGSSAKDLREAWELFTDRLFRELKKGVPFIVEGRVQIATLLVEIYSCD